MRKFGEKTYTLIGQKVQLDQMIVRSLDKLIRRKRALHQSLLVDYLIEIMSKTHGIKSYKVIVDMKRY